MSTGTLASLASHLPCIHTRLLSHTLIHVCEQSSERMLARCIQPVRRVDKRRPIVPDALLQNRGQHRQVTQALAMHRMRQVHSMIARSSVEGKAVEQLPA
jgi:hypothetical protein